MKASSTEMMLINFALIPMAIIQGTWIFNDAKKRGEKYYWLWGIFGLLNIPSSLIIYLLVTRVIYNYRKK